MEIYQMDGLAVNVPSQSLSHDPTAEEKILGWFPEHNADFDGGLVAKMTGAQYKVYSYLRRLCGSGAICWAGVDTIAHYCGLNEKSVSRALPRLKELGVCTYEIDTRKVYTFTLQIVVTESRKKVPKSDNNSDKWEKMSAEKRKKCPPINKSVLKTKENKQQVQTAREKIAAPAAEPVAAVVVSSASTCNPLIEKLTATGMSAKAATQLAQTFAPDVIETQLEYLPERPAKNPAAVLLRSIEKNYCAPAKFQQEQEAKKRAEQERAYKEQQRQQAAREKATERAKLASVSQLTPERARHFKAIFDGLDAQTQNALLEEAKTRQPDFVWPHLQDPERAVSWGLWELVEQRQ